MSYSLKLTECPGRTNPQIYVCEMAGHAVDMAENIRYASQQHVSIIILVTPDLYEMPSWHLE